jgi:5,10-methylenetetrahydromethanopterin reductase
MDSFGISMGVSPREPLTRVSELAAQADGHGFDAMWFIDFQLGMKDVFAAMNLAALASERILIGPGVTNLITRHPTVTANAMLALDELSGGRAVLGLGSGWSAVYGAGAKPSTLGEVRVGVETLRRLCAGDDIGVDAHGGAPVRLSASQGRALPVYIAVSQPGMLRLAGETADGAILMGAADRDFCEWQLQHIYEGLEKAGRERSELIVDLVVTMSVDDDEEQALSDVRAWATSQAATFESWKRMPPAFERFRPEFAAASKAYELVDHLSLQAEHKAVVSEELVRSVAVAGNEAHCIERLREIADLDIDRITFALLPGGRSRRLTQLAERIIPQIRKEVAA